MARVLVTNDDGIDAEGLHHLARAMVAAGHDVVVGAPLDDRSGSGAAVGRIHRDEHIDVVERRLPGLEGVPSFGVAGTPALCVMAARLGGLGEPPDLVVSGINPGCNTGRSVLHSGTVGAALTAANFGLSALAVSIDASVGLLHETRAPAARAGRSHGAAVVTTWGPEHWATAAAVAVAACHWLDDAPQRTTLNLNVPDLPLDELRGVRWAELAPFGTVRAALVENAAGKLQMELRDSGRELPADCDTALVAAGYVAVTAIVGVRAATHAPVAPAMESELLAGTAGARS
jgi:5'-nucleotidase